MRINEIVTEGMVFARSGAGGAGGAGKVKLKWRCETGARAGRIVSSPQQCGAAVDVGKRAAMKKTRARTKVRQARKSKRTKKMNVSSRIMQALNKFKRRGGPKKAAKTKISKPFSKTKFLTKIKAKKSK